MVFDNGIKLDFSLAVISGKYYYYDINHIFTTTSCTEFIMKCLENKSQRSLDITFKETDFQGNIVDVFNKLTSKLDTIP